MGNIINMTEYYSKKYGKITVGDKFERLEVVELYRDKPSSVKARCKCKCGNKTNTGVIQLFIKRAKSCGCLRTEKFNQKFKNHGKHNKWWFPCYNQMMSRCHNPNSERYCDYGGRGIRVGKEWNRSEIDSKEALENFEKWIQENNFQPGLTIERIDNDKDYCPENCTFTTRAEQSRNRRSTIKLTINNETKCLMDWAKSPICVVSYKTALNRVYNGWEILEALTTPLVFNNDPDYHNIVLFKMNNEEKTVADWLKDSRCKIKRSCLMDRLKNGWDFEQALTTPSRNNKRV